MKLFRLLPQEIDVVITCFMEALRPKEHNSAHAVLSAIRRLRNVVDKGVEAGRLDDHHINDILLIMARYSWIYHHFKHMRSGYCVAIETLYAELFASGPYDDRHLVLLEMQWE
ncbi:TPA: hypothetical protein SMQ04_000151 [Pseudomonas putida]|nr:hypothetical protein [Pseudomonas putida]